MEFLGKEYQEPELNFTVGDIELECSLELQKPYVSGDVPMADVIDLRAA